MIERGQHARGLAVAFGGGAAHAPSLNHISTNGDCYKGSILQLDAVHTIVPDCVLAVPKNPEGSIRQGRELAVLRERTSRDQCFSHGGIDGTSALSLNVDDYLAAEYEDINLSRHFVGRGTQVRGPWRDPRNVGLDFLASRPHLAYLCLDTPFVPFGVLLIACQASRGGDQRVSKALRFDDKHARGGSQNVAAIRRVRQHLCEQLDACMVQATHVSPNPAKVVKRVSVNHPNHGRTIHARTRF